MAGCGASIAAVGVEYGSMPENALPGMFPPLRLSCLDVTIYSVQIQVPSTVSEKLEQYAGEAKIPWKAVAEKALMFYRESFMTREDYARENVEWMVRNFGPPKPAKRLSDRQREELDQRVKLELSAAKANRRLGNLILPVEIYSFIRRKIQGSTFASPTEVLEAALPSLNAHRGESPRADFVL